MAFHRKGVSEHRKGIFKGVGKDEPSGGSPITAAPTSIEPLGGRFQLRRRHVLQRLHPIGWLRKGDQSGQRQRRGGVAAAEPLRSLRTTWLAQGWRAAHSERSERQVEGSAAGETAATKGEEGGDGLGIGLRVGELRRSDGGEKGFELGAGAR